MKTTHTKSIMLLVSAALLLTASIVGTFAYLTDQSDEVKNTFAPVNVPSTVVEYFDGETKKNVQIKNEGNIPAYIRAAIVVNWVSVGDDGNVTGIYGEPPVAETDYTITINDNDWSKSGDYYYHNGSVAGNGGKTSELITTCSPVAGKAPNGYQLSVEILAQSIQTEPDAAVQEAWDMKYDSQSKTWSVKQNKEDDEQ